MTDLMSHHLGGDRVIGSSHGVQLHHHHDHRLPEQREQSSGKDCDISDTYRAQRFPIRALPAIPSKGRKKLLQIRDGN